jgi:23S rRNA (uracil1939-C5)-methyltransferase
MPRPAVDAHTDARAETTPGGQTELLSGLQHRGADRRSTCGSRRGVLPDQHRDGRALYALAIEAAALRGWERVYDLYCGIGTIGLLMLAPRAGTVHGLELVEDAVADAIENARATRSTNASFFAGDVRLALRELVEKAGAPTCWSSTRRARASRRRSCGA